MCEGYKLAITVPDSVSFIQELKNNRPIEVTEILLRHQENMSVFEPHFYIAKLGYAGVYLFFLFLLQNIECGYSLEPPRRGGSNVYPQSMF